MRNHRVILLSFLILAAAPSRAAVGPQSPVLGPPANAVPFAWLTYPPSVRKIVFSETGAPPARPPASATHFGPVLGLTYEGGLQNDSWYLLVRKAGPVTPATGDTYAMGRYSNCLWTLSHDQTRVQIQSLPTPNSAQTNSQPAIIESVTLAGHRRLREVLRFGLPDCVPGSLSWKSSNSFAYQSPTGQIRGEVEWDAAQRASTIRFRSEPGPTNDLRLSYAYKTPQDPIPGHWTLDRMEGTNRYPLSACSIESIELGHMDPDFAGYQYGRFRATNAPPILIVESNGVAMAINQNLSVSNAPPKRAYMNPQKARERYLTLLTGAVVVLALLGFSVVLRQKYPPPRPNPMISINAMPSLQKHDRHGKRRSSAHSKR
jgi:hypothetical protein